MVGITRIPVSVETRAEGDATNAYLIGEEAGILVDPPGRSDALDAAVEERSIRHITVTHTHPDHVGGISHYAAETGATVWCRSGYGSRFHAATGVSPDQTLKEGAVLPGTHPITVMDTPGHAPDHVAYDVGQPEQQSPDLLVGDLLTDSGSIFVGPPDGDMRSYMVSLRRLLHRNPERLYPGHGDTIERAVERITSLLKHRRERERRVEEAVAHGASTIDEILELAYDKDLSGVEDLARATINAHLSKLCREGRIRWNGQV